MPCHNRLQMMLPISGNSYWLFTSFPQIKEAMVLRAVLTPLLYSLGATATKTAVAAVHPMYFFLFFLFTTC